MRCKETKHLLDVDQYIDRSHKQVSVHTLLETGSCKFYKWKNSERYQTVTWQWWWWWWPPPHPPQHTHNFLSSFVLSHCKPDSLLQRQAFTHRLLLHSQNSVLTQRSLLTDAPAAHSLQQMMTMQSASERNRPQDSLWWCQRCCHWRHDWRLIPRADMCHKASETRVISRSQSLNCSTFTFQCILVWLHIYLCITLRRKSVSPLHHNVLCHFFIDWNEECSGWSLTLCCDDSSDIFRVYLFHRDIKSISMMIKWSNVHCGSNISVDEVPWPAQFTKSGSRSVASLLLVPPSNHGNRSNINMFTSLYCFKQLISMPCWHIYTNLAVTWRQLKQLSLSNDTGIGCGVESGFYKFMIVIWCDWRPKCVMSHWQRHS